MPVSWQSGAVPDNHFDLAQPLTDAAAEPILFVSQCPVVARLARFYAEATPLGNFSVKTGPTSSLRFHAFRLAKRTQPIAPLGACAE
jgi:hypothetical protein